MQVFGDIQKRRQAIQDELASVLAPLEEQRMKCTAKTNTDIITHKITPSHHGTGAEEGVSLIHKGSLRAMPKAIGCLTNLSVLNLSHNSIGAVSSSIGDLKCLTFLDLSANRITHLPNSIGQLTKLEVAHSSLTFSHRTHTYTLSVPDSLTYTTQFLTPCLTRSETSVSHTITHSLIIQFLTPPLSHNVSLTGTSHSLTEPGSGRVLAGQSAVLDSGDLWAPFKSPECSHPRQPSH